MSEKIHDFEYLYKILKENYPYFGVDIREDSYDWLAHKNEFLEEIKDTKDDSEFYDVLQNIIANLNNGHAAILSADRYYLFKATYQKISDPVWLRQFDNRTAVERYAQMKSTMKSANGQEFAFLGNVKHAVLDNG